MWQSNAYILMKFSGRPCPFKDFKSFRLQLAKELIGEYCSRKRRGRGGDVIHPLPFRHFPIRLDANDEPRRPRGPCAFHRDIHDRRVLSTWYCRACRDWLCHSGDPSDDFPEMAQTTTCLTSTNNFSIICTLFSLHLSINLEQMLIIDKCIYSIIRSGKV